MTTIPNSPFVDVPSSTLDVISENTAGYASGPASLRLRLITLLAVLLPFLGLIAAVVLLWGIGFSWLHAALMFGMYVGTGLGITIGYHRLFTHKSFKTPRPIAAILATLGSMSVEGPLLQWVATHRRHHQHSDDHGDPHSPHIHGETITGLFKGLWHSHIGWMFKNSPRDLARYVTDLRRDVMLSAISRLFPLWVLIGLLIPTILGGLISLSWTGALLGFIWGGLVRVFFVHHITWSINSVCHIWGSRTFDVDDHSRNNVIFGILAFGEGWHNNHHAFPNSARHGLAWWQIDSSYYLVRLMGLVGLAYDIRVPSSDRILAKKRRR
ncbi:MAG TPA: fatty acid desaturase [Phycisphaerales bacterium]|nr:fatty acid desaturase [Phycisphaerales bacterium]